MRNIDEKKWYLYEAEANRVKAILVYPSDNNRFIIDLRLVKENLQVYFQFIYDSKNQPKNFSLKGVYAVINSISFLSKDKPAVYFYDQNGEKHEEKAP